MKRKKHQKGAAVIAGRLRVKEFEKSAVPHMLRHTLSWRPDSLTRSGLSSLLDSYKSELSPHRIPNMNLYSQPGPIRIQIVALNTGRRACWIAAPPHPARRQQIQSILRRGLGHVPGLTQSYVSVSVDAGCAQMLFMHRMKELLLAGLAWAPGSSGSLWEWLLTFSQATVGFCRIPDAIGLTPEPAPRPWLAECYCPGISSLTRHEAITLATFERDLAVTLVDWAIGQN